MSRSSAAVPARAQRAQNGNVTRTQLLDSAARVFAQLGYARTTVADITDDARVSRPTFYAYFASKDEIFAEVTARVRDAFLAAHELPGVDRTDPYELSHEASRAFLAATAANAQLLAVIEHAAAGDPAIAAVWDEILERPIRRVADYVRRLTAEGIAEPIASPDLIAEAVCAIVMRRRGRPDPRDEAALDALADEVTALFLRLLGGVQTPDAGRDR